MGYRDFVLPDGTKVRTRLTDEATLEWYVEREKLARQGYPDRPPDIDTPSHLGWLEPMTILKQKRYNQSGVSSEAIAHYVWAAPGTPQIKLMISWMTPGEVYYLRIKVESAGYGEIPEGAVLMDAERFFTVDQHEALNEFVEWNLREINDTLGQLVALFGGDAEWIVSPPGDALEMERLITEAEADHKQEFANEWAEARRLTEEREAQGEAQAGSDGSSATGEPEPTRDHGLHYGRRLH